jgi:predicted branched-subunit amino acid permease
MKALVRHWRNEHFRLGLRDMASVAPGMAAWGLMTGVAMVQSGLSPLELVLMALTVFAGSSQLAALPLIVAGAPLWVIVVTAFCVNLRFVVFSAQLRPYMMDLGLAHRLFRGYATTDMSFMLMLRRWQQAAPNPAGRQQQRDYLAGSGALGWSTWVVSNFVGVAFAASIPSKWGLGFAGTLALVGILCALGHGALRIVALLVAGAVAVAAFALPLKLNILLSIAVAVGVCLLLEAWWPPDEDEKAV